MAAIRDFAVTEYGAATTTNLVCNMPVHETNDLLIYFASKDGTPAINAVGGSWVGIQDGASAGMAYRSEYKIAASAAEALTLITGTGENWHVVVVAIKGAPTSSPISVSAESGSDDAAQPFAGPTATISGDTNCLVFHAWFTDSGLSPTAFAPLVNLHAGDNGSNSTGVAYIVQKAAGAITAASWFGRADDDGRGIVVAVKDGGSLTYQAPYADPALSSGQVVRPLVGLATTQSDSWPASLNTTMLGSDFTAAQKDVGPGSFTDILAALNSSAAADVTFPTATTDFVYFGADAPFRYMAFNVSTAGVGGVITWEYYTAGSWTATGVTNNLTATGWQRIDFTAAVKAAMAQVAVNSITKYWIRANIATAYSPAIVISQGRIECHAAAYIVASAAGDGGTNPYTDACQNAGASSTTTINGCELQFGASVNLSSGILMGTIRPVLARDFAVDIANPSELPGGVQVTFLDAGVYYASYKIGARGCKNLDLDGRSVWAIDWNGTATPWATRGSIAKSTVTRIYLSTLGYFGAAAVQWSMLSYVTRIAIAGGVSAYPLNLDDIAYVANRCIGMFPFIQLSGAAAMIWAPLQFGGGDPVAITCNLNTFQFPTQYDGTLNFGWNAAVNVAGIKFYPKSGDVLNFTNCVFTSASAYRFEWDASSASSGWTGSLLGSSVVKATVTLRALIADLFKGMSFINCPAFTQNAAPLDSCKFSGTKVTSASPAAAAVITNSTFTSAGTGHAIEIGGTAANITLTGLTFTGYAGSNGSTGNEAIYVNIASGSMTINISGGNTPSIRTAGATVTVVASVTLTITGIVSGSDVVILSAGTETVLTDSQENSGTTFPYSYPVANAGNGVDIGVFKSGYRPFYIRAYTLAAANASLPVAQVVDRDYLV